jgi:predicted alpha/beta-fold hydrolase
MADAIQPPLGAGAEANGSFSRSFRPRRFLRNGHLQTIMGNYLRRVDRLPPAVAQLVEVAPGEGGQMPSQVLCHCHFQAAEIRSACPTAIIVHGLEGSSDSQYVIGNGNKLWKAGANVIRMNMRNCGDTERLTSTLYHSGLSADVDAVMRFFIAQQRLQSVSVIGYSMGGNLVLKLAGELGAAAPPELKAVVGISPALDLGPSADALHEPLNRIYEIKFLRDLLRRYRYKATLFPEIYDAERAADIGSLREFDDRVTAFYSDFASASDYYHRAAAARVVDRIRVPTLILHALDDPFIRLTAESRGLILANPAITYIETQNGGHCAFLADPDAASSDDGYWAEATLLRFLLENA